MLTALMLAALLLLGCKADATQLLVVIRSDLPAEDVRVVRVSVTDLDDPGATPLERDFDVFRSDPALPFSFGVTPPGNNVGSRVRVRAAARNGSGDDAQDVVVRSARVGFVRHQTLLLELFLEEQCRDVVCDSENETCVAGRCRDDTIDDLPPVRPGTELDGGPRDGSADAGAVDAGFDAFDAYVPPTALEELAPANEAWSGSLGGRPILSWSPMVTATEYEVSVVSTCSRTEFRSCTDETLVEGTVDVGTRVRWRPDSELPTGRHFWKARACDDLMCGPWSELRYLFVGARGDADDDGDAEAIVGAPSAPGAAVHFGRDDGTIATSGRTLPGSRSEVGAALSFVGDVNGDGFGDIGVAVGGGGGGVQVHFGNDARGLLDQTVGNQLGALDGCDLDGDGFSDVIVGSESAAGGIWILHGAEADSLEVTPLAAPAAGQGFGASLACAGDLDRDGLNDLLVGSPDFEGNGRVVIYFGDRAREYRRIETVEGIGRFGAAVADAGDVDGDGLRDYVVGAPGDGNGAVSLVLGAGSTEVIRAMAGQLAFGTSLAGVGDTDGDGFDDVVIGAPGSDSAVVLFGGASRTTAALMPEGGSETGGFGTEVAGVGDVNGDGLSDIVVAVPVRDGAAVFFGGTRAQIRAEDPPSLTSTLTSYGARVGGSAP
ncbi:MAG: integrin alpha [Myxococcota bacterium]